MLRIMKKKSKLIVGISCIPFFLSMIAVLGSADGTQDCLFCHHPEMIYGLDAMVYNGGLLIIIFYPIYVFSCILIFRELYKIKYKNIKKSILCLITGLVSLIFSIILVFCVMFMLNYPFKSAFQSVCIYHPFILMCNIASFIYLIRFLYYYFKEKRDKLN